MSTLDDILGKKPKNATSGTATGTTATTTATGGTGTGGSTVANTGNAANAGGAAAAPAQGAATTPPQQAAGTPAATAATAPAAATTAPATATPTPTPTAPAGPNGGGAAATATAGPNNSGVAMPQYGPNNGAAGAFAEDEAKAAGTVAPAPQGRYLTTEDVRKEIERQDKILAANREETPEEKARREKRERRNKMFAAMGDGISALANLFFTTKGAPNMYNPKNSMTERQMALYEKAAAARDKEKAAYNAAANRHYEILTDADARAMKRAEAARQAELDKEKRERQKAQDAAKVENDKKQNEVRDAQIKLYNQKTKESESATNKNNRMGTSSWVSGRSGGGSGGGKGGKPYGTFQGVTYMTKADYDKAVVKAAKKKGVKLQYDSPTTDEYGNVKTVRKNRTIAGMAAEIEGKERQQGGKTRPTASSKPTTAQHNKPTAKPAPKKKSTGVKWK